MRYIKKPHNTQTKIHFLLQLRAAINSNEWNTNWKTVVANAIAIY